ncbi:MAG: glycosyltransferase family 2 protein [Verrucomicrobia bacterium]|nr:glycosyltransferase family 2 protein [Verrucomicrobiota bacterium]
MKKSFIKALLLSGAALIPLMLIFFSVREKKMEGNSSPLSEKPFVIVISSYNNETTCEQNILSALSQQYSNFRIVFMDDDSKDGTYEKVKALVDRSPHQEKVTLLRNWEAEGTLKNLYQAVHGCKDEEIVVRLEGHDLLAHPFVLTKLNKVYANPAIWMTYGNYLDYPSYQQKPRLCQKFPKTVLRSQRFRHYKWVTAPLHTFYAGLFKKISSDHLIREGKFLPMAGEVAVMIPMLEMASNHFQFIDEVLYLCNRTPLFSHLKDRLVLHHTYDRYVRSLPAYQPLEHAPYLPFETRR